MIRVTLLNKAEMILNAELVETVEAAPDTIITLTTGRKIIVKESVDDIIRYVTAYQVAVHGEPARPL